MAAWWRNRQAQWLCLIFNYPCSQSIDINDDSRIPPPRWGSHQGHPSWFLRCWDDPCSISRITIRKTQGLKRKLVVCLDELNSWSAGQTLQTNKWPREITIQSIPPGINSLQHSIPTRHVSKETVKPRSQWESVHTEWHRPMKHRTRLAKSECQANS